MRTLESTTRGYNEGPSRKLYLIPVILILAIIAGGAVGMVVTTFIQDEVMGLGKLQVTCLDEFNNTIYVETNYQNILGVDSMAERGGLRCQIER